MGFRIVENPHPDYFYQFFHLEFYETMAKLRMEIVQLNILKKYFVNMQGVIIKL